jgi:hypothetical protein
MGKCEDAADLTMCLEYQSNPGGLAPSGIEKNKWNSTRSESKPERELYLARHIQKITSAWDERPRRA